MDFVFDALSTGETLKFLVVKDEFTREIVNLEVGTSFKSGDVVVALQLQAELMHEGVTSKFIEPGKRPSPSGAAVRPRQPWQNGFVEGFNSRFGAEFLSQSVFASLSEAQVLCESFRRYFNDERLHSSLRPKPVRCCFGAKTGYCPPSEFRAGLVGLGCGKSSGLALIE